MQHLATILESEFRESLLRHTRACAWENPSLSGSRPIAYDLVVSHDRGSLKLTQNPHGLPRRGGNRGRLPGVRQRVLGEGKSRHQNAPITVVRSLGAEREPRRLGEPCRTSSAPNLIPSRRTSRPPLRRSGRCSWVRRCWADPPPMKWSALWYGFEPGGRIDVEEATQA